jgi:hypothetical protein
MLVSVIQVERLIPIKFISICCIFKANRDELTPPQIQQAHRMGIESVIDR